MGQGQRSMSNFWHAAVDIGAWLCGVQQRAKKIHYQSRVFVCVSNNRTDAVDWLLIGMGVDLDPG